MSTLLVSRDGGLARLSFNRPQVLNALDAEMAEAFLATCRDLAHDDSVRAVLLSGQGRAFSAGGDVARMREDPAPMAERLITAMHEAVRQLALIDAPVIASVHGAVAGGGFSLAMAADLVIAADDARFNLAYIKLGASCDMGSTWSLPRVVGLRRALEIALLGDSFDAAQALQMGLINRVVPRAALEAETESLAQGLARGPTRAAGRIRRLMRTSFERSFDSQLEAERAAFLQNAASADFEEGLNAFLDKRAARFRGR